ncbi:hypothetical protein ACFC96_43670 [Streptomyces sp. NPDC055955]|uniref:hypothetical protein n=1 Tax=Streptomyces sp. NPDC055955 TaxID=3345665 RepID=UPI0035D74EB9
MANMVWHTKLRIYLDLTKDDLGHEELPNLWETIYGADRLYAARNVPVPERDLQCAGVCRDAGVEAWMHLRLRANGRREAVHEKTEDENRHTTAVSDEHKAYQERILRAAQEGGFHGNSEVRTRVGRSWIQTDTLVEGAGGRRIGWEVQLSSAATNGPRSVRARASKAHKNGITPAWHTDRADYAQRHDTHWTRSNNLPAYVIAKTGDLRVISGFRALDFWHCDLRALYPCPHGTRRCGKTHVTPKPRDILFDDLVRHTAAGAIVPIEHRITTRLHRFWVTSADRDRLDDLNSDDAQLPPARETEAPATASRNRPTCRPGIVMTRPVPQSQVPEQPFTPPTEDAPAAHTGTASSPPDLPDSLLALQRAADAEHRTLQRLTSEEERTIQRAVWFRAAAAAQSAVTQYARRKRLNRCEIESQLRRITRHPQP